MKLGLGLAIGAVGAGGNTSSSLINTNNFSAEGTQPSYAEIVDDDSFRIFRDTSFGRFAAPLSPSGSYRITGTLAAYDGAEGTPANGVSFRVLDNFSVRQTVTVAGALDITVTINSGTIKFQPAANNTGFRIDNFAVEAV